MIHDRMAAPFHLDIPKCYNIRPHRPSRSCVAQEAFPKLAPHDAVQAGFLFSQRTSLAILETKKIMHSTSSRGNGHLLFEFKKERISTQCVCCGSTELKSSPAVLMPFVAHRTFGWKPVEIDESWGLNTIKSGHAYSICKSLFCTKCHLLYLDIRFSEAELGNLYADYRGQEYTNLREHYEPGYRMRNEGLKSGIGYVPAVESFLEPHVDHPLSILDWGGDTGKNTPFKDENTKLDIFDISDIDVIPGAKIVNKKEAQSNKYKLVVCSNVLEHVPYPADLLLDISLAMDLNSVLYIEVPHENVVMENKTDLHLQKKHWHEHINFFSPKSLHALMENAGFQIIDFNELEVFSDGKLAHLFQMACKLK